MTELPAEMDRIARFFDAEYAGYDEDLDILEAYAARMGDPLLELGCGTGRALLALAEMRATRSPASTSSPAMLEIARAKADEQGLLAAAPDRRRLQHRSARRAVPVCLYVDEHVSPPARQPRAVARRCATGATRCCRADSC